MQMRIYEIADDSVDIHGRYWLRIPNTKVQHNHIFTWVFNTPNSNRRHHFETQPSSFGLTFANLLF